MGMEKRHMSLSVNYRVPSSPARTAEPLIAKAIICNGEVIDSGGVFDPTIFENTHVYAVRKGEDVAGSQITDSSVVGAEYYAGGRAVTENEDIHDIIWTGPFATYQDALRKRKQLFGIKINKTPRFVREDTPDQIAEMTLGLKQMFQNGVRRRVNLFQYHGQRNRFEEFRNEWNAFMESKLPEVVRNFTEAEAVSAEYVKKAGLKITEREGRTVLVGNVGGFQDLAVATLEMNYLKYATDEMKEAELKAYCLRNRTVTTRNPVDNSTRKQRFIEVEIGF